MADTLAQQVLILMKRFGTRLNRKVTDLLLLLVNHKSAGSFGAIAGFALAIIFTWKFLRPPSRPQSGQRKLRNSESTSSANSQAEEVLSNSYVEVVDELHPPVELTLGQMVRTKLRGGRKITCQLLGVILEENSPEDLQEHATVKPSVVKVLLEISKSCDLYLMDTILDDQSEDRVLLALENAGLFGNGGLMKDKVLFCSTENGRLSFVRQLEPDWHVDTNPDITSQLSSRLARFVRSLCLVCWDDIPWVYSEMPSPASYVGVLYVLCLRARSAAGCCFYF